MAALTPLQRDVLRNLARLHKKYPDPEGSFLANRLGPQLARVARHMEGSGLVTIDRLAENCFRYALTPAGHDMAARIK